MGVSYADHYPYPYFADVAVPGPAASRFPASAGTGAGTYQPYNDGPGTSPVSPVTPDLLRSLLRSLSRLR